MEPALLALAFVCDTWQPTLLLSVRYAITQMPVFLLHVSFQKRQSRIWDPGAGDNCLNIDRGSEFVHKT